MISKKLPVILLLVVQVSLGAAHEVPTQQRAASEPRAERAARMARRLDGATSYVYKAVDDVRLQLYAFYPQGHQASERRPAIVFFFGGGWIGGSPGQFAPHCEYLASRGMVAMTAEYRVQSKHGATIPQCVSDAKSAVRWVRANAAMLGVDPARLAAGGGSAGGHLAACTGVVAGLDDEDANTTISSRPNAMVLFNPVMVVAPVEELSPRYNKSMARRSKQFGGDPTSVSPYHHIENGQPPMIMFFGSADRFLEGAKLFHQAYRDAGNRCELAISDGAAHGFFNFGRSDNQYFIETCRQMDRFLASHDYVDGEATIEAFVKRGVAAD